MNQSDEEQSNPDTEAISGNFHSSFNTHKKARKTVKLILNEFHHYELNSV